MEWIWEHDWWNLGSFGSLLLDLLPSFGAGVIGWTAHGWRDRRKARKRSEVEV